MVSAVERPRRRTLVRLRGLLVRVERLRRREEIVCAVASGSDRYDGELKRALEQRGIDRVEVILRLILRAGAYEILDRPDIDPPLSINEYVAISEAFFGGAQPTFVNGVLDRLAREAAGDEQG